MKTAGELGKFQREMIKLKPDQNQMSRVSKILGEIAEATAKKAGPDIISNLIQRLLT
jgi:hypothetical protein